MANQIYVHPDATSAGVIKVGGVCYQRVGPSDHAPGEFHVDDTFDDCDTCKTGKKCFQEWTAVWNCDTRSWSGPVSGSQLCLPSNTSTDWVKVSSDPSSCEYQIYVPDSPDEPCAPSHDDCSDLDDTATPALPFGGDPPPDCCGCYPTCLVTPNPDCCPGAAGTPSMMAVKILAASVTSCFGWDTGNHCHVHALDVSGLAGQKFNLPYVPGNCSWQATFDVKQWVKMNNCIGDCMSCSACTPNTDITVWSTMTIIVDAGGGLTFLFSMKVDDDELDNNPDGFDVAASDPTIDEDFEGSVCCDPWTASGPGPADPTAQDGTIYIESVAVWPCP